MGGADAATAEQSYPLTGMQEGMLFQGLSNPGGGCDILQVVCRLNEPVDADCLRRAWKFVTQWHEALRVGILWRDRDRPEQQIVPAVDLGWRQLDWEQVDGEQLDGARQAQQLDEYLAADRATDFDLERPPLFRLCLIRLAADRSILIWTIHHIVVDGRSLAIVMDDVFAVCGALRSGQKPVLPEGTRYSAFLEGLRRRELGTAAEFWREELRDVGQPTRLPIERNRQDAASVETGGERQRFRVVESRWTADETEALELAARAHEVTVNTLVQAAWGVVLSRYSGEAHVCFGTPRACRYSGDSPATGVVGMFMNTVPVPVAVDEHQPVVEFLKEQRRRQIAVREHEWSPLANIREWTGRPSAVSLFEIVLAYEHQSLQAQLRARGDAWRHREISVLQQTGIPLTLSVFQEDGLVSRCVYDCGRFDGDAIRRLLDHFHVVLRGIIGARAQTRVGDLPLLTEQEIHQQLVAFQPTATERPQVDRVQELFEVQAARSPEAIALVEGDRQLTYHQTAELVNDLAGRLNAIGIQPGHRVGILGPRGIDAVVALLGILRAGGVCVPLPADAPEARLSALMVDADLQGFVRCAMATVPAAAAGLSLVEAVTTRKSAVVTPPAIQNAANDLACLIYTSGTTGIPKGVCITHAGITNLVTFRTRKQFAPGDFACAALTAPLQFDASYVQILSPLSTGGILVLTKNLAELMESPWYGELTVISGTPSLIGELMRGPGLPPRARAVGLGAESIPAELIEALWRTPGVERVINSYGVTECTCYSTSQVIFDRSVPTTSPDSHTGLGRVIGRPIDNARVLVLDRQQRLLPVGVPGELCISGLGVARGYWRRDEQTAERFISDPFFCDSPRKCYRTGDRVRWLADGRLEFLGRLDHQINLRGYRIEPDEIEAVLTQHPAVGGAVVTVRCDRAGSERLVAYLTPRSIATGIDLTAIRDCLISRLPESMIPSAFVVLEKLPLNANGKVDRGALPEPTWSSEPAGAASRVAGPLERRLLQIWSEVLGHSDLTERDNFFESGGNSLVAVRLFARLQRDFNVVLPLDSLLKAPTVAQQAELLRSSDRVSDALIPIQPGVDRAPLFAIASGSGNSLFWRFLARHLDRSQPVVGVGPARGVDGMPVYESLPQVARQMADAVVARQPAGPVLLLGYSAGAATAHELAHELESRGREVGFLGIIDTGPLHYSVPAAGWWKLVPGFLANLWYWVCDNDFRRSVGSLRRRWLGRWWRWLGRWWSAEDSARERPPLERRAREEFIALLRRHQPTRIRGRVTLFRARCQTPWRYLPRDFGWTEYSGGVTVVEIPGCEHFGIIREPYLGIVARHLQAALDAIARPGEATGVS